MKNFKLRQFIQQGDCIVIKVSDVKGKKLNHKVLAEGEVTGHCHEITKGDAELYEHDGTMFLRVISDEAILTHQEHEAIIIPKGDYEIKRVREYDHFLEESRKVQD